MRYFLDFGSLNGGLPPPAFSWFRDAATGTALTPPLVTSSTDGSWTYFFDLGFPLAGSQNTTSIEYGVSLGGVGLTDTISQPGYTPTRFFLDFDSLNGGLPPPTFAWYRDAVTKAAITPPALVANAAPAWNYYFDAVFPSGTTAIEYGITLNGVSLTDVIAAPPVTVPGDGSMTLAQIRDLVRQESDTENDPHISDDELTTWINKSRNRLYGKLVTSFGDDYYSAKATIVLDGSTATMPLPNGVLYGAAAPYFKGLLLEAIGGAAGASPDYPIPLQTFNLRERGRASSPFIRAATYLPKYRLVGSNLEFAPRPQGGLTLQAWYAPKLAPLSLDTDVAEDWNGWLELVVVDCVIKAIAKQERDASIFIARQNQLREEIEREAANRNIGEPNTVTVTEGEGFGPFGAGGLWS